jgi:hypothetical protein
MAGYTRQSVADIIANAVIKAAPVNAEYNAIRDAFAFSGGHKHDGSSTEGAYVPLIADVDALNKVVVDTSNNRISFYSEVSGAAVEQVRIQDGAIVPVTDNDVDLGTSGLKFKNLYVDGIGEIGSVTILGGTIDNTVIGGTTPAAADFTTMDASGNATVGGTFDVTGNTTVGGTLGVTGVTTLGTANITSADLNSGAIDSTTIGATTPAAGTFTTLTANTSLTAATADINGGTIDGVIIGGTTSAAATVTDLTATGTSTLTTVDINGGAIDGATIGASSAAAGSFTTVSTSGQATLATADINGGTIDGTTIGTTTPAAITGTTVTATSFVGPVTGAVTGNVTGNVTGDLTGDVTGNITSSGSSSFNNVTIDGTLNMNAGTTATITNLTSPTNTNDAATKGYVDTSISNLVDSAPGTLDTLNELAAALGDDPNFSTTITNSIATKLPLAGGTMTGAIAMSTNKITGLGDPTAAQDAMTKAYADATYLALSGGTMTGAIDMGSQKITTTYTPTNAADLTTKTYVDTILGSGEDAVAAAAAAATSASNAATSETNAATSASNAATSESNTATLYDNFDDRYLGAKASAPALDNDGDALVLGALYFNTTVDIMYVYGTSGWQSAGSAVNGTSDRQTYTATSGQTVFAATYDTGYVDVYLNGVKLLAGTDFTATNGTSITLASGAAVSDIVDIVAYGTFVLADHYSKSQSDARYVEVAGDTMTGNLDITGTLTSDGLTVDTDTLHVDATNNRVGIGTSSPKRHLHINDPSAVTTKIQITNSATGSGSDGEGFQLGIGSTGQAAIEQRENQPLSFSTNNTERMRIDSSGNVGIGTTTPAAPIDALVNSAAYVGRFVQSNTANGDGVLVQIGSTASSDYALTVRSDGGNTPVLSAKADGNVGIGTFSPSAKAHIKTTSEALRLETTDTTGDNYIRFDDPSGAKAYFGYVASASDNFHIQNQENSDIVLFTNATEAMRIDSSGNLLVGTTNYAPVSNNVVGISARGQYGELQVSTEGSTGAPLYLNRKTSDGDIAVFRKDGSTVGSIGVSANILGIVGKDGNGGLAIQNNSFGDIIYPASNSYGGASDNAIDLGYSSGRFKDLYLSGGVYLGGTGSANKLDDYETGYHQTTIQMGSGSATANSTNDLLYYTIIGNMCFITGNIGINSVSSPSGTLSFTVPFAIDTSLSETSERAAGTVHLNGFSSENGSGIGFIETGSAVYVKTYARNNPVPTGACEMHINIFYPIA